VNESRPRPGVLRTSEARFEKPEDFPWTPHYFNVESGLRMAFVDTGPRNTRETMLLLHGEPTRGYHERFALFVEGRPEFAGRLGNRGPGLVDDVAHAEEAVDHTVVASE